MTLPEPADVAPGGEAELFVLHARPLRSTAELVGTSQFSDPVWRLGPAQLQQHQTALSLNFATLPAAHRLVVKQLCYAMLSGPLPPAEQRPSILFLRRTFCQLKRFLDWLHDRAPGHPLADLRAVDLLDYQRHLLTIMPSAMARTGARGAVRMLWRYHDNLTTDRLAFDPCHIDGWGEPHTPRAVENATDRIPEPILGPLIVWALRFVDDFAPDIITADRRRRELRARKQRPPILTNNIDERLQLVVERYRERGQQLPGRHGQVNLHFLAQIVGCDRSSLERHPAAVDSAARELGIAENSPYDTPITATLDGQAWIDDVVSDHRTRNGLACLSRHLQIACYIVIAYLSGMRDSEIKHLRRGCLRTERDSTGRAYRWAVTSLSFKGEQDPAGVEATWVVGHPAARAITVLEQLQPPETDELFAVMLNGPGAGPASWSATTVLGGTATINQLNDFADWINDYCTIRGRDDVIPQVNGRNWRLTTRQFRRTLAWFIARRPGGAIAGAIQYRHQAVQMFEGYAGTSDSGFRAEVESEQALARGEHLLAMIDQHEHKALTGPAAEEAGRRLEQFGELSRFTGSVITDPQRLKRLLRRDDPAIYPGTHVTCVFNPDKALCLKQRRPAERPRPHLSGCEPMACTNVALTQANTAAWHDEVDTIDQRLHGHPAIPPLLAARLRARRVELSGFLTRHGQGRP